MKINRRFFIEKFGLGATAFGLSPSLISTADAMPVDADGEQGVVVSENNAVADTTAGKVRGYTRNGVFTFKGIPYAGSTAEEGRFLPPVKPAAWTGVRNSLVYGPICPQKPNAGWAYEEYAFLYQWNEGVQGEDCLRLNVWTPALNNNKKRPVMFWIHGGAFFSGSSQEHPSFDGENLSRTGDVVVVSVNHRLNVFGFLNLSEYGQKYSSSGNVGMLDLVAALEWVRDNISNFGGDPGNVTIFGQSGGAAKVTALMAMPSAKGLFHKAISQSSSTIKVATHEYSAKLADLVVAELGLNKSNIEEIHKLPFRKLVEAGLEAEKKLGKEFPPEVGRAGWQPVVDGKILLSHPFYPEAPAISAHIPMIIGTTRNEGSASIGDPQIELLDEEGLKKKLAEKFGEKSDKIYQAARQVFPSNKPVEILSYLGPYNRMAVRQAEIKAAQKGAPVFLYMFGWHTPVMDGRPRAFHCSEIPFVFNNSDRCDTYTGGGEEPRKLADMMSKAWINFAYSGNPSHKHLKWTPFTVSKQEKMYFDKVSAMRQDTEKALREALEAF